MTVSSSSVNLAQASRLDLTVSVSPVGPFVGNITLTGAFTPSNPGLTVTFSPSRLGIMSDGAPAQSTLEIIATRNTPGASYQLIVTATSNIQSRVHSATLTVRVSPCLIATAAFGSELAPEVQFLRDFRDQQILPTYAGFNFMNLFNAWYYSFSPNVADYESVHATSRDMIRTLLYPLITILHASAGAYSILEFQPELGVLVAGMLASSLIGFVYMSLPLTGILLLVRRRLSNKAKRRAVKWVLGLMGSLVLCYGISELMQLSLVMMFASAGIVMVSMLAGSMLAASLMLRFARKV